MILAIDPGSINAGYCFIDNNKIIDSGSIRSNGDLFVLAKKSNDVFHNHRREIVDIYFEGQFIGIKSNQKSIRKCGVACGIMIGSAVSQCCVRSITEVSPRKWTNLLLKNIPGDNSKQKMKTFVKIQYGFEPKNDEADSICIAYCACNFNKKTIEA